MQHGTSACKNDSSVHDICRQLRRCFLKNAMDCLYDLSGRFPQSGPDLLRSQCCHLRKSCDDISALDLHRAKIRFFTGCSDLDLDILRCILPDKEAVLLTYIIHDRMIKIISCNLHRSGNNHTSYGYDRNIRGPCTDVHDQIAKWLGNVYTCPASSSDRLVHKKNFPGS